MPLIPDLPPDNFEPLNDSNQPKSLHPKEIVVSLKEQCLLVVFTVVLSLVAGCANLRTGCRITVANASDRHIQAAMVKDKAGVSYAFSAINPHVTASYQRVSTEIMGPLIVTLTSTNGISHNTTVPTPGPIPPAFQGRVLLQIEEDRKVRLFILSDRGNSGSADLPWAVPPSWQVAPGIPGFTGEE
ncbi:MAG: hypothetical protein KAH23_04925 [Kiritimatiellae bacterium]|nr:hypothetical protein [Kiritimatiellia bacterium]